METVDLFAGFSPLEKIKAALLAAQGLVLAEDICSPEQLPSFHRSTRDGFAVRARDSFACSESEPALFTVAGESSMGQAGQDIPLCSGQAVRIWTGGALPNRADAVVMVEHTRSLRDDTIMVYRPVAPGENVIAAGEDYRIGETVLARGKLLRPQELGVLSGLGIIEVPVYRRPRVAILSTGDELVPASRAIEPGKIRDIHSITLSALAREAGGSPVAFGICGDEFDRLRDTCISALLQADVLLLSGGSSLGRKDFTLKVFESLDNTSVLLPGVSARPGKPAILAQQGNKALIGLPGHVASAVVIFYLLVRPLIRKLIGLEADHGLNIVQGRTAEQIPSAVGREEYVRVCLKTGGGDRERLPWIKPVYGHSGLLSPLVAADGLLPVGRDVEGLDKGVIADVIVFPSR
ncbi:MAG: molybdopterin molybdenumtransferase MoeA [Deltaproteobacteria bacterium]|nr:MAG: molybdopterin molybdenumtransferase MoeA [Deltaproteobacteria bacterium]